MTTAKLKQRYGQVTRQTATLQRVQKLRENIEALPIDESTAPLLSLSFEEWCKSCQIKTKDGLQPFALFDAQKQFADLIVGEAPLSRKTISLLSSRQTGKTSLMLAIMSYLAQSRRQFTGMVIHRSLEDARILCRRLKSSFLPGDVELLTDSLSLLHFKSSGSQIMFRSSSPGKSDGAEKSGRGQASVDLVFVDESSHTSNLIDVLNVLRPTLQHSSLGVVVFAGTGSDKQSYFYECLSRAAGGADALERTLEAVRTGAVEPCQLLNPGTGESKGNAAFITHWRSVPQFREERSPDFMTRVRNESELSEDQINGEYQLCFSSSATSSLFDFSQVMAAIDDDLKPYEPGAGSIVYVGIDPAGIGNDYAVAIALEKLEENNRVLYQVCQIYRRKKGTAEQHLSKIADMIGPLDPICAVVEKNSMGQVWGELLAGLLFSCEVEGFATTRTTKDVLIGRLQIALELGFLRIPKGIIADELLAFRRDEHGRLGATGSNHDDTVLALALALKAARFNEAL